LVHELLINDYSFVFTAKEAAKMEQKKRQVYTACSPLFYSEHHPVDEFKQTKKKLYTLYSITQG